MKKTSLIFARPLLLIGIFTSLIFTSCNKNEKKPFPPAATEQTQENNLQEDSPALSIQKLHKEKTEPAKPTDKIDFDLTKMSSTMVYSTVFDMLVASEDYENKVIKVEGMFNVFTDEVTGERYYAVLVQDATACCQQGLEFIWQGQHDFPQDYPEEFSEIVVTGSYTTVEEDGLSYSYIKAWSVEEV
ncbi:MAG: hypothetical protein IJ688_03425 [Treponema sp.]|nr:hypothetical protein [Treponema sp.]